MHGGESVETAAARHAGRLTWALALTATYMLAEVAGGLITGSLALLADAAHMLTDVGGLALARCWRSGSRNVRRRHSGRTAISGWKG